MDESSLSHQARVVAERILSETGEPPPPASHLQWLYREVFKLMKRELEVSRREEQVSHREQSVQLRRPVRPPDRKKRAQGNRDGDAPHGTNP